MKNDSIELGIESLDLSGYEDNNKQENNEIFEKKMSGLLDELDTHLNKIKRFCIHNNNNSEDNDSDNINSELRIKNLDYLKNRDPYYPSNEYNTKRKSAKNLLRKDDKDIFNNDIFNKIDNNSKLDKIIDINNNITENLISKSSIKINDNNIMNYMNLHNMLCQNSIDLENARENNKREMIKVITEAKANLMQIEGDVRANLNKIEYDRIDKEEKNRIKLKELQYNYSINKENSNFEKEKMRLNFRNEANKIQIQKEKVSFEANLEKTKEENINRIKMKELDNQNNVKKYKHNEEMEQYSNIIKLKKLENKNKKNFKQLENELKIKELENECLKKQIDIDSQIKKDNIDLQSKQIYYNHIESLRKMEDKFENDKDEKYKKFQINMLEMDIKQRERQLESDIYLLKKLKDIKCDSSDLESYQKIKLNNLNKMNQSKFSYPQQMPQMFQQIPQYNMHMNPMMNQPNFNPQMNQPYFNQQMNQPFINPQMMHQFPQQMSYAQNPQMVQPIIAYPQQMFTPGGQNINNSQMNAHQNYPNNINNSVVNSE